MLFFLFNSLTIGHKLSPTSLKKVLLNVCALQNSNYEKRPTMQWCATYKYNQRQY